MCYYEKNDKTRAKMNKPNSIEIEIDKLGRILIPIKIRKKLGITLKSRMMLSLESNHIILSPICHKCALCGCQIKQEKKMQLCDECIEKMKTS